MAGNVGNLNVRLGADISGLTEGMERAQRVVKRGADTMSKSAKASAQVFVEARRSADSLLGSLDPLYAAQVKYDRELERAQQLFKGGALTAGEMARVQAGLKAQLDGAGASLGTFHKTAGGARMGMQQLGYQIGDVAQQFSLGVKPQVIFAQQSGQVIQAFQLMGGEANKFTRFLGGPWGIALSAATVVLAPLIAKLFETKDAVGDLVDKMREQAKQTALNERANEVWKRSIDGVTDTIRKQTEELNKQRQTPRSELVGSFNEQRQAAALAEAQEKELTRRRGTVAKQVEELRNRVKELQAVGGEAGAAVVAAVQRQLDAAEQRLANLDALIAGRQRAANEARANARELQAKVGTLDVEAKLDPVVAATQRLEREEANLLRQRRDGIISQEKYNQQLEIARKRLEAVKESARASAKAVGEMGRQVSQAEAASIARSAGFQVNSAGRSYAEQKRLYDRFIAEGRPKDRPVAPPGTSAHEGAKNRWALDIQITNKSDIARINKVFADKGVTLTKRILEHGGRVLHVEGSRGEAASAESALEKAERERVAAAQRATKQENDFTEARAAINAQFLAARNEMVRGIEGQAQIALDQIEDERSRKQLAIRNDLAEGKYGEATSQVAQARAEQLLALNDAVAGQRRANVNQTKMEAIEATQFRITNEDMDRQIEALKFRDEMAETQTEHRQAQLAIIDAVYRQRQLELEHEKQLAIRNGATQDEIDAIQAKINDLKNQRGRDEERARRGTRSPMEDYKNSLPTTPEKWNEELENIEVGALKSLEDGLVDIVTGAKSVKEAFHDMANQIIADLIRIAIRRFIIGTIVGAFSGGGEVQGFATGGFVSGPGGPKDDKIPAMLSDGEFVLSAKAVKNLGVPLLHALNDGDITRMARGGPVIPRMDTHKSTAVNVSNDNEGARRGGDYYDLRGAVVTEKLYEDMKRMSAEAADQGANMGVRRMRDLNDRTFGRALGR